jgi:hypothetical protein
MWAFAWHNIHAYLNGRLLVLIPMKGETALVLRSHRFKPVHAAHSSKRPTEYADSSLLKSARH